MPQPVTRRKLIAFIDGFNLYYGLLRDAHQQKWLDLNKMMRMLHPHYDVVQVKYFTAEVDALDDPGRQERQHVYWRALEEKGVKIILGKLETRAKDCGAKQCTFAGFRKFSVPIEKRTDVNLAIHIITDARVMRPDAISIVSADTDLMPAMEMVAQNWPCQRLVFIPCTAKVMGFRRVDQFELIRWEAKRLKEEVIADARFDDSVQCPSRGEPICCPRKWLISN